MTYRSDRLKIMALHWLRAQFPDALLVPELAVAKYGDAMIDVGAITASEIVGIEIKGDGDSPARLARQGWVYSRAATRMFLLPAPSLLKKVLKHIPPGWGLLEVKDDKLVRGHRDPAKLANAPAALLDILWKPELLRVGSAVGVACPSSRYVHSIAEAIAESAPLADIRAAVLSELLRRDWSTVPPRGKVIYRPSDALPSIPEGVEAPLETPQES